MRAVSRTTNRQSAAEEGKRESWPEVVFHDACYCHVPMQGVLIDAGEDGGCDRCGDLLQCRYSAKRKSVFLWAEDAGDGGPQDWKVQAVQREAAHYLCAVTVAAHVGGRGERSAGAATTGTTTRTTSRGVWGSFAWAATRWQVHGCRAEGGTRLPIGFCEHCEHCERVYKRSMHNAL